MSRSDRVKQMPHSPTLERSLLGACLIDPDTYPKYVMVELEPDDMYLLGHRYILSAISYLHLNRDRHQLTYETLCQLLSSRPAKDASGKSMGHSQLKELGGAAYITGLIADCSTSLGAREWVKTLSSLATKRRVIDVLQENLIEAFDADEKSDPEDLISAIINAMALVSRTGSNVEMMDLIDILHTVADKQREYQESESGEGLDPVLQELRDACYQGRMYPGSVNMIGAYTGAGKSMLATNIGLFNVLIHGMKGLLVSTEMPAETLGRRFAPIAAQWMEADGITNRAIAEGKAADETDALADMIEGAIGAGRLVVVDRSIPVEYLLPILLRAEANGDPFDFVILDFMQGMDTTEDYYRDVQRLDNIVKVILRTAISKRTTFLACSVFPQTTAEKEPDLSMFRGSSMIVHAAGLVVAIYMKTPENDPNDVNDPIEPQRMLKVLKVRDPEPPPAEDIVGKSFPINIDPDTGIITTGSEKYRYPGF